MKSKKFRTVLLLCMTLLIGVVSLPVNAKEISAEEISDSLDSPIGSVPVHSSVKVPTFEFLRPETKNVPEVDIDDLKGVSIDGLHLARSDPLLAGSSLPTITNKATTKLSSSNFQVNFSVSNPSKVLINEVGTIIVGPDRSYKFFDNLKGTKLANSSVLGSSFEAAAKGVKVTEATSFTVKNYYTLASGQTVYSNSYTIFTPSKNAYPHSFSIDVGDAKAVFSFRVAQGDLYRATEVGFELYDSNFKFIGSGKDSVNYSGAFVASYSTAKYVDILNAGTYYCKAYTISNGVKKWSSYQKFTITSSTTDGRIKAFLENPSFKDGAAWGPIRPKTINYNASGCCSYTVDFCNKVWGTMHRNGTENHDIRSIRKYDVVKLHGSTDHWFVILDIYANGHLYVAEASSSDGGGRVFVGDTRWMIDYSSGTFRFQHDADKGYNQTYNFIASWHH